MNSRSLRIVLVLVAAVFAVGAAEAASGADDPFYASATLPAAGTIGLAVLGAIIVVAGAFVLFRKPRG